jgi:hypothetical protein
LFLSSAIFFFASSFHLKTIEQPFIPIAKARGFSAVYGKIFLIKKIIEDGLKGRKKPPSMKGGNSL